MTQYKTHSWWENAAMIHLLGYRNLLDEGAFAPDQAMLARVRFLDAAWNHTPVIAKPATTIIRHYAGEPNDVRRRSIPRDAAVACRAAFAEVDKPTSVIDPSCDAMLRRE